eukprot:15336056-Ditylum_brightwellii.AAC.2
MYGDTLGMLQSSSIPEATLKKKHYMLSNHKVRETIASGAIVCRKVDSKENRADMLTKALSGPMIEHLENFMWLSKWLQMV